MAQKIVELRMGVTETLHKINKVKEGTIVSYSSENKEKGTIEERLTRLKG